MRTVVAAVLLAFLVASPAVYAQGEEPPLVVLANGGRLESAELGYALTVPEDWIWLGRTEPFTEFVEREEVLDPALKAMLPPVPEGYDPSPVAIGPLDDPGHAECFVRPDDASRSVAATIEMLSSPMAHAYFSEHGIEVLEEEVAWLELAAGHTARLYQVHQRADGTVRGSAEYFLEHEGRRLSLVCSGITAPEDRWLAIAETFEFLPAEE